MNDDRRRIVARNVLFVVVLLGLGRYLYSYDLQSDVAIAGKTLALEVERDTYHELMDAYSERVRPSLRAATSDATDHCIGCASLENLRDRGKLLGLEGERGSIKTSLFGKVRCEAKELCDDAFAKR